MLLLLIFSSCKKGITKVQQAFSAVYTIAPGNWITSDGGFSYSAQLQVPELDKIIYTGGGVLVYISFSGTSYYEAIPQVFDGIAYGAIHSKGYVDIDISALSGNRINPRSKSISVKIILIDAQALSMHKNLNLKDLGVVQKTFNIK